MSQPWYKVVTPRREVAEGRSFHPDEFAIALEQVVAGIAPPDYTDPIQFFARTSFTRALTDNLGLVLRRLSGQTANTAPVLTLLTQFGGGKTHTLTSLYHLAHNGDRVHASEPVRKLLSDVMLPGIPQARVGVFVGNAWDPQVGAETPWIDLARQLAGDEGVQLLGTAATISPPGTDTLLRIFAAANAPVLLLFDEVLNFVNRHRSMAEPFYAFIQNLTIAMTGTTESALVVSLPRSQVEMTDWDVQWQERITKVVRRVANNLIANDEAEIADVVRRRLFEDLGSEQVRRNVATAYANWCFENRAQIPPEWTAMETASSETEVREYLRQRFLNAYPFHPATLSVFHRKWSTVPQFQATRGTLAMLAQWVSLAYREGYTYLRNEPLITLGSAPLHSQEFRGVVLGQLGETRLLVAIETDIAGATSHARALDVDTRDALRDIHRRVGAAILFESSGGQVNRIAHLPELRFAIGGPGVDTTSVDSAAIKLEDRSFYIRQIGTDGYQISYKPTLKKVISERRASLDYKTEVYPAITKLVKDAFDKGRSAPIVMFPGEASDVNDSPKLTLVVMDPSVEWNAQTRAMLSEWTRQRGALARLYPGALVWCVKQPGSKLRQEVQDLLAWLRVEQEVSEGALGGDLTPAEIADLRRSLAEERRQAEDEVRASYRYLAIYDPEEPDGIREIDLGSGHAATGETLSGRVLAALRSQSLLNEGVGAGYIDRNWPPALLKVGAWPLNGLRQSFLNGVLTRLLDPDSVLRAKIVEFVQKGEFGLASGQRADGTYDHLWFAEPVSADEVAFDSGVFLLRKDKARALKEAALQPAPPAAPPPVIVPKPESPPHVPRPNGGDSPLPGESEPETVTTRTLTVSGAVPADSWNRVGTKLIPKLRSGNGLAIDVTMRVTVDAAQAQTLHMEIRQVLDDLGIGSGLQVLDDDG